MKKVQTEKKRSYKQLENNMNSSDFKNLCKKIGREYANSEAHFARRYFCGYYNISEKCFYGILQKVVEEGLLDDNITSKIDSKLKLNKMHHAEVHNKSVATHMPIEQVRNFAEDFAQQQDISKYDLATAYEITPRVADLILVRAIVENIIDDETANQIYRRSVKRSKPGKEDITKNFFKKLREARELNKKEAPSN